MAKPIPGNNEFEAAEKALRAIGSNLWFGGLSDEWQDFLVSNTVECFDNYELSMEEAANALIGIYQKLVRADPSILQSNPWDVEIAQHLLKLHTSRHPAATPERKTMTDEVKQALGKCVSLAFSDDTWRFWGFPKRPKHGSFWNKFRPKWRVDIEQTLFAEIIISNAAAYVAGGVLDSDGVDEMARFFTTDPQVGDCIGYSSSTRLREDILEYAEAPVDEWPSILTGRLPINSITDKKLAASVLVGCAQYSRVASIAIDLVRRSA